MARKPLIAGNWKMNLDHLEAISSAQKLAFAFPKDGYELVDVALTVPFTDLRSVQTLVEGDKLQITYGAQDVSQHDNGSSPRMRRRLSRTASRRSCAWVSRSRCARKAST